AVVWHHALKPIPFDPAVWARGGPKLRFRMKDSLEAKYKKGELDTRDIVDRLLGPDDDKIDANDYRYFHLENWDGNPWYLHVRFDDHGRVVELRASPD